MGADFERYNQDYTLAYPLTNFSFEVLTKWNEPTLYSFQESLPRLPVPKLNDTISRYLLSMRPLLNESEHNAITKKAEEFQNGIGKKLQRYLVLKSWWSPNYVTDWWDEYVYQRNRSSLMINSNCYVSDHFARVTRSQSARAANIIHLSFIMRERMERQEVQPLLAQDMIPLCSWQYRRLFNTFREPGIETDKLIQFDESDHVAIYHKGCFYKLIVYHQGRLLNAIELKHQIDQILNAKALTTDSETNLASLTALDRTKWATARSTYFSSGINQDSLHAIESAAFFLSLDDDHSSSVLIVLKRIWTIKHGCFCMVAVIIGGSTKVLRLSSHRMHR